MLLSPQARTVDNVGIAPNYNYTTYMSGCPVYLLMSVLFVAFLSWTTSMCKHMHIMVVVREPIPQRVVWGSLRMAKRREHAMAAWWNGSKT